MAPSPNYVSMEIALKMIIFVGHFCEELYLSITMYTLHETIVSSYMAQLCRFISHNYDMQHEHNVTSWKNNLLWLTDYFISTQVFRGKILMPSPTLVIIFTKSYCFTVILAQQRKVHRFHLYCYTNHSAVIVKLYSVFPNNYCRKYTIIILHPWICYWLCWAS